MWRFIAVLLLCQNVLGKVSRIDPLVETKLGLIRGLKSEDGQYSMFLGIPYAVVDEEHPFSESTPSTAFNGTFNAHDGTVRCPQFAGNTISGQLDCLKLNVYVPNSANTQNLRPVMESIPSSRFNETFNAYDGSVKCPQAWQGSSTGQLQCLKVNVYVPNTAYSQNLRPVMVHIHGGGFNMGGGSDSPQNLLSHDIIYVSITYRLGIYGFMCTNSPKAPGNVGLKDQLTALRWINEHIDSFGGDKSKITVFGESAGAMSIHLHLLSSYEKLFDQAIIQSGPATSPFTIVDRNNEVPIKIAAILGFVTEDVEQAIDFISKADVDLATAAGAQLPSISTAYPNERLTKPCVEKEFEGIQRFLEVNANEAIPEKVKTTKVIIGFCSQEMKFLHEDNNAEFYENYSLKELLKYGFDETDFDESAEDLRHFYIGNDATGTDLANLITNFASDFVFNHPTVRAMDAMVKVGPEALYHYMFSYNREGTNDTLEGVSHASETIYLFNEGEPTVADQLIVDRVTTMWANFVKYGDPTPEITELLPVKWESVPQDSMPYLNIDTELTLSKRPFHDRMAYWDLFYQLNNERTKWYHGDD